MGSTMLFGLFYLLIAGSFFLGGIYNLFSREGRYDAESNKIMTISSVVGIILGAWMLLHAFGVVDIPIVPYL